MKGAEIHNITHMPEAHGRDAIYRVSAVRMGNLLIYDDVLSLVQNNGAAPLVEVWAKFNL